MEQVWVAETWGPHGDESREAAQDGLKGEVDTLYVDDNGDLAGKPEDPEAWQPGWWQPKWAAAYPMPVQGRAQPQEAASAAGSDGDDAR